MEMEEIIHKFSDVRVAVIGDVMLDSYVYGSCERISPEAPVPVVNVEKTIHEIGGAGNVAVNVASLGGNAFLFGYVGDDVGKIVLEKLFDEKGIDSNIFLGLKQTIHKTRLISNGQQIARMDEEEYGQVSKDLEKKLVMAIGDVNPEVILVSDYAKGTITRDLLLGIQNQNPHAKIFVDPKPKHSKIYSGAFLIKPNLKEGREMTGLENPEEIGLALKKKYRCNILLTKGKNGMSLFNGNNQIHIPTQAKEVYDVTGAGDSVFATLGLAFAAGASLDEAAYLANNVAGIVIGKAGTASISQAELERVVDSEHNKIKNLFELQGIVKDYQRKGQKVVWTNGCFDILHPGHTDYLKKAKSLGDYLIVGLNSDDSIRQLKGSNRPINSENHRAEVLSSLESVDYVVIFPELRVNNCLNALHPDIYAKGGDYNINSIDSGEREIIEGYGGEFKFIPIENQVSTSKIIDKIRNGSG